MGRRKKKRIERHPPAGTPEKREPVTPRAGRPRLSRGKRLLFHAVTVVLFFGILELVLALAGVRPVVVEEDPYVGFASQIKLFERTPSGDYRTAVNKLSLFNEQSFPARKGRGTFRIFTLGGSCTYGRPFDDATSWSGWLRTYLAAVDPSRRWEVVNAGGISYASYRVATLMEELVDYDPDLFIVYSGHNEFLEKRTYSGLIEEPEALTRTKLLLQKSRLWALGRGLVEHRRRQAAERYELTGEVQELLDTSVGLDYYFRDEPFRRQVLDHYRFNLRRMVSLARAAGAEVVFVTVPVNEKDMSPFKSQHLGGLSDAARARHEELLAAAHGALDTGRAEEARELARQALEIDDLYADGHFLHGRTLLALGRYDEADAAFGRAIAEDVCPLRALEETNRIIDETAREAGAPLVDYRRLLDEKMREIAGHTVLGDELFLDHAHVTVDANGILARALVETLGEMGIADLEGDALARVDDRVAAEVLGRVDAEAQALAYKNLSKLLLWAGKQEEAGKYARLAGETLGDDWEVRYNEGVVHLEAGRYDEAIASLEASVRLDPKRAAAHDQLGMAYSAAGRPRQAIAAGRKAVELDPRLAEAWNNLGTYYGAAGEHEEALEATRKALALRPDYAEAHNNLGKVHFDRGELDRAMASFERAVELRPNYAEAIANRGLVLGEMGRFDEAARAFTAALELAPRLVAAHLGKGRALLAAGDPAAAVPSFETAIELDPGAVEAYEALAASLMTSGEAERAWEVMKAGLASNPDTPEAARLHRLYGRSLAQERSFDEALRSFARAVELDPGLLAAWVDLGNLYMVLGRRDDAVRTYRDALAFHDGDDGLHHILATALLIGGRLEEGRAHLRKALEINPANTAVADDLAKVDRRLGSETKK